MAGETRAVQKGFLKRIVGVDRKVSITYLTVLNYDNVNSCHETVGSKELTTPAELGRSITSILHSISGVKKKLQ